MPAMITILLAAAHAKVTGRCLLKNMGTSEWVAGDVSSKQHVCHHIYPGIGMIKTMTNNFDIFGTMIDCKFGTFNLPCLHFATLTL